MTRDEYIAMLQQDLDSEIQRSGDECWDDCIFCCELMQLIELL